MKTITPRKCEVTIQRPNGETETMTHPKVDWMNDATLKAMNKAMADAKRGKVVSYRNIDAVVEMEEADYQTGCERCSVNVDTRSAYKQQEWTRFGGKKVQVAAYYCESCKAVLAAVGAGEESELQQRAGAVSPYEPETKED